MNDFAATLLLPMIVIFCRIGGCLMVVPGFSSVRVSMRIRLMTAVALSVALTPVALRNFPQSRHRALVRPRSNVACFESGPQQLDAWLGGPGGTDGGGGKSGGGGELKAPLTMAQQHHVAINAAHAQMVGGPGGTPAPKKDEAADEEAVLALRFAHFEKALLSDALAALRAAMGDSPPESLSYVVAGAKGRHLERSYFADA